MIPPSRKQFGDSISKSRRAIGSPYRRARANDRRNSARPSTTLLRRPSTIQQMLIIIQRDGAISLFTPPSSNSIYSDLYKIPSEITKDIRLTTIGFDHIPNDDTHVLQIHKHYLRQSTILCIDVLTKLKLDSFR